MFENKSSAKSIFLAAIEIESPSARDHFVESRCGDNSKLAAEVRRLLDNQPNPSFLESPCVPELAGTISLASETCQNHDMIGREIGPYKIRELIGEGGMGAVYVAKQEKPLRRRVALKVIKPGMDSAAVLGRFEAERNALALMDHPNIAKVLDAGQTDQGHPYFVMELVNGIPITDYCDDQKLTIRQRLELFMDVCQAIQHAHQKGIIHRDIKPSNVLVTELDGKPIAKVIDFGVAKALNQTLTEHSVYTAFQTVIGTPLYMSPEQASFSAVDVDTRSDVYSLGVLLYELLTGTTPFTSEDLRKAAQDEVFRFIRESEPPRPSNRISTLGKTATRISQCRRTQPEQLGKSIKGDLDWIVMQALAKERSRRYKTADAFSQDIARYLGDEPIEARPDSAMYRMSRFYRRNRIAVWACSAILLVACGAFFFILREKERADEQRRVAVDALNRNQMLVIQRALMRAFEGKVDAVDKIISQYQAAAKVPLGGNEWPVILRGAALIHAGRYREGQKMLRPLIDGDLENVIPATSLLGVAHMYDGDWDTGIILANRIQDSEPRSGDFADLDQLCLGYALVFVDTNRAVQLLAEVLERNPTWVQGHAVLADAKILLGNLSGNDKLVEEALAKANATVELFEETPFALNVCLYAHLASIQRCQLKGEDYVDLVSSAERLVSRLSQYDKFILAKTMPAQYFDTIGDEERSVEYWTNALADGSQMWRWSALGRLYWNSASSDIIRMINDLDSLEEQPWTMASKAFVLADVPGGRAEALDIFDWIRKQPNSSMTDRFYAIQIPLLLGDKDLAISVAKDWVADSHDDEFSIWMEMEYLKIIATNGDYRPEQKDRLSQILTSYMLGLLAVADGEREAACAYFEKTVEKPFVGLDSYWAEAYLKHMESDSNWPSENPNMRNDGSQSSND